MNTLFWSIFGFLITVTVLVFVHEMGHFLCARYFKIPIKSFHIGFGKALWQRKDRHGTDFIIGAIPLGGYVKFPDISEDIVNELKGIPFQQQRLYARFLVVCAGPAANLLFAFVVYSAIAWVGVERILPCIGAVHADSVAAQAGLHGGLIIDRVGTRRVLSWSDVNYGLLKAFSENSKLEIVAHSRDNPVSQNFYLNLQSLVWNREKDDPAAALGLDPFYPPVPPVIGAIIDDMPAQKAGMQSGDLIKKMNGRPTPDWKAVLDEVQLTSQSDLVTEVQRGNALLVFHVFPKRIEQFGQIRYQIGISSTQMTWPEDLLLKKGVPLLAAIQVGAQDTFFQLALSLRLLKELFIGKLPLNTISGPVGIASVVGASITIGWSYVIQLMALLSVSMAMLNLLPIPGLDGWHACHYLYEAIFRRPLSDRAQLVTFRLGMMVLFGLMAIALYNDLSRLFSEAG